MATIIRALTPKMKEVLMDCHEAELLKQEPYDAGAMQCAKGLIQRGLVATKMHQSGNGKKYMGIYVTPLGKEYLKNIEKL